METLSPTLTMLGGIALVAINLGAFAAFHIDKRSAEQGLRRIREDTLLALAFFGGSPGAYAARQIFRHKTRKQPFSNNLFGIVVFQVMVLAGAATWTMTG